MGKRKEKKEKRWGQVGGAMRKSRGGDGEGEGKVREEMGK